MFKFILDNNKFNNLAKGKNGYCLYNKYDIYIGKSIDKYGEFSELEADIFRQICFKGDIVIEVGANIGTHTLIFSNLVGNNGAVFAFEPQRVVFQTLCANMALNSITNVYTFQTAISDEYGYIKIPTINYNTNNNFGGIPLEGYDKGEMVKKEKLDSYIDRINRLKLLKIDVEGMEIGVVRGAKEIIKKFTPIIYIENDRIENSKELIELISSYGYRLYWHLPPLFNPDNFAQDKENIFENLVSVNMLCIHEKYNISIKNLTQITNSSYHPMADKKK